MARKSSSGLDTYRAKRRFDQTPEPRGRRSSRKGRRYSIQMHHARRLHYDLRLELDGVLKSWAITKGPSIDPSVKRLAVRTEDHPVDYIAFEGTIPEGHYGAGTVLLWDRGEWEPLGDPHEGLEKGKLSFHIHGERLKGRWALVRFKGERDPQRENWLLVKERDENADSGKDPLERYKTSVSSGRTRNEVSGAQEHVWKTDSAKESEKDAKEKHPSARQQRNRAPRFVQPALATLVDNMPPGDGWLFEIKFDGYRALASVAGPETRIFTRSGLDWTQRYGPLAAAFSGLGLDGALIDGEIVVSDKNGRSSFSALQRTLKGEQSGRLAFFAFDLLFSEGVDFRCRPLIERKAQLRALLGSAGKKGPIFYTDHIEGEGGAMLDALCKRGFEGVIAKRADQPYRSGRGKTWLKIKCRHDQEFVVVGWSPSDRGRPFSSLLLSTLDGNKLTYAGRVGTGFSDADLKALSKRFETLGRKTSPLAGGVPDDIRRRARWVRPELVAQIGFAEFTPDGIVRQARYLGLRKDKSASTVTRETPAPVGKVTHMASEQERTANPDDGSPVIHGVPITNPDRILYPEQGVTKLELAEYMQRAAKLMLPHMANRLVSLVRCPQGRQKKCFFQRHAGSGLADGFNELSVTGTKERESYLYLTDTAGLVSAAQMGVLELHLWGSSIDDIERPDRLVFDLDPDPDLPFETVVEGACRLRAVLAALELESLPMLTGGKGIHVVTPIVRRHEWSTAKAFTRALAERLEADNPQRYVSKMTKSKRAGRIFVDYLRNDRAATAIAPYSPRARKGAPVAWPLSWRALHNATAGDEMTIKNAFKKRRSDPWKNYGTIRQSLKASALRALDVDA